MEKVNLNSREHCEGIESFVDERVDGIPCEKVSKVSDTSISRFLSVKSDVFVRKRLQQDATSSSPTTGIRRLGRNFRSKMSGKIDSDVKLTNRLDMDQEPQASGAAQNVIVPVLESPSDGNSIAGEESIDQDEYSITILSETIQEDEQSEVSDADISSGPQSFSSERKNFDFRQTMGSSSLEVELERSMPLILMENMDMWPIEEHSSREADENCESCEITRDETAVANTVKKKKFSLPRLITPKKPTSRQQQGIGTKPANKSFDSSQLTEDAMMYQGSKRLTESHSLTLSPIATSPVSDVQSIFRHDPFTYSSKKSGDNECSPEVVHHEPSVLPGKRTPPRQNRWKNRKPKLVKGGILRRKDADKEGDISSFSWPDSESDASDNDVSAINSQYCSTLENSRANPRKDREFFFPSPSTVTSAKDNVASRSRKLRIQHFRVKPYHCFPTTKVLMTENEINDNMLQPSEKFEAMVSSVQSGYRPSLSTKIEAENQLWGTNTDGRIGSLRVEVLSCNGISKHKADVCVYLICGDTAFSTDVIPSCRSPMWPACSKRAACFPMFHAYAKLYVGVFDVTLRKTSENDIFCGRVCLDVGSLRPDIEYDVTLPLRASCFVYDRRKRGVVRLRLGLHWFNNRLAILSYLPSLNGKISSNGSNSTPSILCSDPKTFRNVALTIHGQDLPGKYSRRAFQATMREFNLYLQNLRSYGKQFLKDVSSYTNPAVSLYIFLTWMHCVWKSSIRLVPVYLVGLLILLLLDGYVSRREKMNRITEFKDLSLHEIMNAFLFPNSYKFATLEIQKCTNDIDKVAALRDDDYHHLEFPFSHGREYRKPTVESSIIKRSTISRKEKREEVKDMQSKLQDSISTSINGDEVEDDTGTDLMDADSEHDSLIHGDIDNVYHVHSFTEDEERDHSTLYNSTLGSSHTSPLVLGPLQDADVRPVMKTPPQILLARLESALHKSTFSLSMDQVFVKCFAHNALTDDNESSQSHIDRMNGKRIPLDEFDKRLGYRVRHPNPVTEITSSFLGPLMRIFRVMCFLVRVIFNVGMWSDPILSFWFLLFLLLLMVVLLVFPWRLFFFLLGVHFIGPQNMFWNQKSLLKGEKDDNGREDTLDNDVDSRKQDRHKDEKGKKAKGLSIHNPISILKERRQKKLADRQKINGEEMLSPGHDKSIDVTSPSPLRQAFSASGMIVSRKATSQQREILVPYSRLRKERFFDWPPDPSAAQAVPIRFHDDNKNNEASLSPKILDPKPDAIKHD